MWNLAEMNSLNCEDEFVVFNMEHPRKRKRNDATWMSVEPSAETSASRTPQPGGGLALKGGPVNSQYVVLFTQRMIKVP